MKLKFVCLDEKVILFPHVKSTRLKKTKMITCEITWNPYVMVTSVFSIQALFALEELKS